MFYTIGSGFRADFLVFSHVWSHHTHKGRSTHRTSGCKGDLDRLSSCEVDHIGCVDTEENQQDLCRLYSRCYLSQSVMLLLSYVIAQRSFATIDTHQSADLTEHLAQQCSHRSGNASGFHSNLRQSLFMPSKMELTSSSDEVGFIKWVNLPKYYI